MLRTEAKGEILIATVDRPSARNALDLATITEVTRLFQELPPGVRAVVLTGGSGTFVSGGDLRQLRGRAGLEETELFCDVGRAMCDSLEDCGVPVIAALEGSAIGGGAELAMACDLRIMASDAMLAFRQARMGVTTAWGTFARLVATCGAGRAADLLYSAGTFGGLEAQAGGLVESVTPPGRALETAIARGNEIARGAPLAVRGLKDLVRAARRDQALRALERERFIATWTSADHAEAVEAYFEKRPPVFVGR